MKKSNLAKLALVVAIALSANAAFAACGEGTDSKDKHLTDAQQSHQQQGGQAGSADTLPNPKPTNSN